MVWAMLGASRNEQAMYAEAEQAYQQAVSLFPGLAEEWMAQQRAQTGWRKFGRAEYENLAMHYPVTWILAAGPQPAGMACPYDNGELVVCRVGQ